MIDKHRIETIVREYAEGSGLFLVEVKVSSSNRITIFADKNDGINLDDCTELHRHIEKNMDRDVEDFELQVSSPGIDMPFSVIEQYYKNEGKSVEVIDNEGMKYSGKLKNVTTGGFELETELKSKGKQKEKKDLSFNMESIKSTKVILTIK